MQRGNVLGGGGNLNARTRTSEKEIKKREDE